MMASESRTFTQTHRCFPEALQFFVHYVAMNELLRRPFSDDELRIAGPPDTLDLVALCRVSETLAFLRGGPEPQTFTFSEGVQRVVLPGDNVGTPAEPEDQTYTLPASRAGVSLCVYLLGSAWERHAKDLEAKLPRKDGKWPLLPDWPKDCAFFFHLRNACFHGGTFLIKKLHEPKAPLPGCPDYYPEWRTHKFDNFNAVNGRRIFAPDGILHVSEVLPLLWDMGEATDKILGPLSSRSGSPPE